MRGRRKRCSRPDRCATRRWAATAASASGSRDDARARRPRDATSKKSLMPTGGDLRYRWIGRGRGRRRRPRERVDRGAGRPGHARALEGRWPSTERPGERGHGLEGRLVGGRPRASGASWPRARTRRGGAGDGVNEIAGGVRRASGCRPSGSRRGPSPCADRDVGGAGSANAGSPTAPSGAPGPRRSPRTHPRAPGSPPGRSRRGTCPGDSPGQRMWTPDPQGAATAPTAPRSHTTSLRRAGVCQPISARFRMNQPSSAGTLPGRGVLDARLVHVRPRSARPRGPGLGRLDLAVLRRRRGDERVQQLRRGRGDRVDRPLERLGVGLRRLLKPLILRTYWSAAAGPPPRSPAARSCRACGCCGTAPSPYRPAAADRTFTCPRASCGRRPAAVDGHQILSPSSSTAAGTMIVRTTNVSSRMPTATMKPMLNANVTGSVISTENVPGQDDPRARDHGAGGRQRAQHALARAVLGRLLAHAAHQEDRVVDAERDQEDERERRQRRVDARVADDVARRTGSTGRASRRTRASRSRSAQRRDERAQQDARMIAITSSASGTISFRSRAARLVEVVLRRGAAADEHARRPAARLARARAARHSRRATSRVYGSSSKMTLSVPILPSVDARSARRPRRRATPPGVAATAATSARRPAVLALDEHVVGSVVPAGNVALERLEAVDGLGRLLKKPRRSSSPCRRAARASRPRRGPSVRPSASPGRCSTRSPTRRQTPRGSASCSGS